MVTPELLRTPGTVFIDDEARSWLFDGPVDVISATTLEEVEPCVARIEKALKEGRYVAGFIAYDAGLPWAMRSQSRHEIEGPLLWFGVYDEAHKVVGLADCSSSSTLVDRRLSIDEAAYCEKVERIRRYIEEGDVYQVNFTCKLRFENQGTAVGLFSRLRGAHPVGHSAFVNCGDTQIISLSPELFLRKKGDRLLARPMKGTMRRGRWPDEDDRLTIALKTDPKNRAENLMIVDLMRNDLGRLCRTGTVRAPDLFLVERFRSVLQMTSDVVGNLDDSVSVGQLLRATFPPGSVTGAPKSRAVEIIDELESESRGAYCGSVGAFFPNGDFALNVAIRTIVQRGALCELGIGSGIVYDSDPRSEWAEVQLKSKFIEAQPPDFRLFETLLRKPNGEYQLLDGHMNRLMRSANYFGFPFCLAAARRELASVSLDGFVRVKLLLRADGVVAVEASPLAPFEDRVWRVLLSPTPVDSRDVFLFHKTTARERYDRELAEARVTGYDEVLHVNERRELTEGCITNLLFKMDGQWWTPPLDCGLLPGVWRASLELPERVLRVEELAEVEELRLCNSVRGEIQIKLK